MLGFSLPEILFLAVLALVVIGPKQLPEVARTIGRFLNELRRASNSITEEFRQSVKVDPIRLEDDKKPAQTKPEPAAVHKPNEGGNYVAAEPMISSDSSEATVTPENPEVKKS